MQLILFSLVPHPPRGQSSASATRPHWWNLPGELNQAEYLLTRGLEAVPQTWSWHELASFPLVSPLCPVLLWTLREREKLIPLSLWQFNLFGIFSNELWMNPATSECGGDLLLIEQPLALQLCPSRSQGGKWAISRFSVVLNLNLYFIFYFFLNGEDTRKTIPQHCVILH